MKTEISLEHGVTVDQQNTASKSNVVGTVLRRRLRENLAERVQHAKENFFRRWPQNPTNGELSIWETMNRRILRLQQRHENKIGRLQNHIEDLQDKLSERAAETEALRRILLGPNHAVKCQGPVGLFGKPRSVVVDLESLNPADFHYENDRIQIGRKSGISYGSVRGEESGGMLRMQAMPMQDAMLSERVGTSPDFSKTMEAFEKLPPLAYGDYSKNPVAGLYRKMEDDYVTPSLVRSSADGMVYVTVEINGDGSYTERDIYGRVIRVCDKDGKCTGITYGPRMRMSAGATLSQIPKEADAMQQHIANRFNSDDRLG